MTTRGSELARNTIILGIGRLAAPFASFLLLPVYTNFIAPGEYGTVDLITTYIGLLIPVVLLRLDMGLFRYLISARGNDTKIGSVLTSILLPVLPLTLVSLLITAAGGIFGWLPFAVAVAINIIAQILLSIFGQLARGLGRNRIYAIAAIFGAVANIILGIIFVVVLRMDGYGMLLALGLSTFINSLILAIALNPLKYIKRAYYSKELQKEMLKFSFPLVLENSSWWVMNLSDRTIVSVALGVAANGIYSVSNKITSLASLITSIFWMSWSETAAVYVNDKDRNSFYSKVLNAYISGFGSACLMLIACMPFIFPVVVGGGYSEAYLYIPILIIAAFFSASMSFLAAIYTALKLSRELMTTSLWSAMINLVIHLLLIKFIGLYAAAISTLASYMFMATYRYFDLRKHDVNITLNKTTMTILLISCCAVCLPYYLDSFLWNIFSIFASLTAALSLNRGLIKDMLKISTDSHSDRYRNIR